MTVSPLTSLAFTMQSAPGAYALLLGSGASRSASIPTGWEITLDLIRKVSRLQGQDTVQTDDDLVAWYKTTFGGEPDYSRLLEEIANTKEQRQMLLRGYFEPTTEEREDGKKTPQAAHKAIAQLVARGFIRVIVTTNFDRLVENAIRDEGLEPVVIQSADAINGMQPLVHQKCLVLKIHGDYLDSRILNTGSELAVYPQEVSALLDRICDEFGLIVAGWSGEWDPALRATIERAPNRRYGFYWLSHGEPRSTAIGLIARRGGTAIRANGADSFFVELLDKVAAIEELQEEDPKTVDLMVSSLKRYVLNPVSRIKHNDLFRSEVTRAKGKVDEFLDAEFRKPTTKLANAHEIFWNATFALCRMGVVSAHYGDSHVSDFFKRCYSTLTFNPIYQRLRQGATGDFSGGFGDEIPIFAGLSFACSVAFGFILAERYEEGLDFILGASTDLQRGKQAFLRAYADANSKAGAIRRFNPKDYQKKFVPFSDFMCGRAKDVLCDFGLNASQMEQVTETFELLCALASARENQSGTQGERKYYFAPGQWIYKFERNLSGDLFPSIPYEGRQDAISRVKNHPLMQAVVKIPPYNSDWSKLEDAWRCMYQFASYYQHNF